MEPVCPDDGGVPADRRYSYAKTQLGILLTVLLPVLQFLY